RKYYDKTGQRITFEYVLIGGFNDSQTDAKQLTRLLHGVPHKLNLIVWNPIEGLSYQAPKPEAVQAFLATARKGAYAATLRDSRGADIAAACGQLTASNSIKRD
ncbi:23S rRNA (adenine(2503)-C(2))-methyltransferase RlmN, partial [bacterium]|nr:23S rRNA (adenine(2503)-C(2))-methyltransferase RlmN [bacterium]